MTPNWSAPPAPVADFAVEDGTLAVAKQPEWSDAVGLQAFSTQRLPKANWPAIGDG